MIDDHPMSKIIIESFVLHHHRQDDNEEEEEKDKDGQCQIDQFNYRICAFLINDDRREKIEP